MTSRYVFIFEFAAFSLSAPLLDVILFSFLPLFSPRYYVSPSLATWPLLKKEQIVHVTIGAVLRNAVFETLLCLFLSSLFQILHGKNNEQTPDIIPLLAIFTKCNSPQLFEEFTHVICHL